jgi:hypothetical protein
MSKSWLVDDEMRRFAAKREKRAEEPAPACEEFTSGLDLDWERSSVLKYQFACVRGERGYEDYLFVKDFYCGSFQ